MVLILNHAYIFFLACIAVLSVASPSSYFYNGSSFEYGSVSQDLRPRADKPFYLRIAPLGASITNGYLSSDGNGYRKHLRDQLRFEGWEVNMVGSLNTGTMNDNNNEGHLGWVISQTTDTALPNIVPDQPNLVLINVGTNNAAATNSDISAIYNEYIGLLDKLWQNIPGATVILSTLLPNKTPIKDTRGKQINEQIKNQVVSHYSGQNKKLIIADMDDGFITTSDLNDDTHPTDAGYKKMASVWWAAFQKVEANGWLTAPPDIGVADNSTSNGYTCPKVYGKGDGNYQIQKGSGTDDGNYVHKSEDQGNVWKSPYGVQRGNENYGDNWFFAQLVNAGQNPLRGGEVDEIIWARANGDGGWEWNFWINNNNNDFGQGATFDPGYNCAPNASRFADINDDGLDDYICISTNGEISVSYNKGGNPPTFDSVGKIGDAPAFWADGYTVDLVHFADIDGDGRADWCVLLHVGDITCRRNGGYGRIPGTKPSAADNGFWQDFNAGGSGFSTIFPSQHRGNAHGVNLVDINGDFKSDWLFMDETGKVDTFVNNRGTGVGMTPDWRYADVTHGGLSIFNVTNANSAVKFGRMYGTGRRDYIWIQETGGSTTSSGIELRIWKNVGAGGTYLKGDGSMYCDMDGDGKDDYIWVGPNGEIDIYLNVDNPPLWDNHLGVITLGIPRKNIRIADLDGDGKCDLISVDREDGQRTHMWHNQYDSSTNKWNFVNLGLVSGYECLEYNGVVENDYGVRFADLTGDGKADYLCIQKSGTINGCLNRGFDSNGKIVLEPVGQIKLATHYDRQNVRFNDVNGDGRADLLWTNKYTGDTTVWYNAGEIPTSGSHFKWDNQGALYKAWDRGSNMNFGALGGQHRADIIQVIPRTNIAYISYNRCSGGTGGGDDPNMGDPGLPAYSPTPTDDCTSGVCPLAAITFPDNSCMGRSPGQGDGQGDDRMTILRRELQYTADMAQEAANNLLAGDYYNRFFAESLRLDDDFALNTAAAYQNIANMLAGIGFRVDVTCNEQSSYCLERGWHAHMNDNSEAKIGTINICSTYWSRPEFQNTDTILDACQARAPNVPKIPDLREAQRSRSAVLLHEMTHTNASMSYQERTFDYAYGLTYCLQVATGPFDRTCMTEKMKNPTKVKKVCPIVNGREICQPEVTARNADTYSFVAAGIFFTARCGTAIPFPPPPSSRFMSRDVIASRQSSCPADSDVIIDDGVYPIGTYVHFGDSYGAGTGTGTTSGDKCRVGSNNFGRLIYSYMNDANIKYDEKVCAGDTLTGLTKQVDNWSTAGDTSIATISIGGNDIGFYDLIWYCVITPNTASLGSTTRRNCVDAQNKARAFMSDTSIDGLRYKLSTAYLNILGKANHDYFQLYVSSYIAFFNPDTSDCAKSTFHYWFEGYNPSSDWPLYRIVYLTTDLRAELNGLVTQLNEVIAGAVDDVNSVQGNGAQAHYVDVNSAFVNGGHRWCENPNAEFHEPDASRADTYFFLSSWSDIGIGGAADNTASIEAAGVAQIIQSGSIPLPDSNTCNSTLGTDFDPYDYAICQVSVNIAQDPTGPEAMRYQRAEADISSGNYNSQDISWYLPTRQIKTFHPRSPGMVLYKDALIAAMVDQGQL